jgi:hypothetical protein
MTDRETAYHGHQTDAERLDDIRRRHEALRAHSGETDYAHRVIMDCAWLLAQVEALRAQVQELTALGVSLHKAADAGAQAERAAVVAYLKDLAGAARERDAFWQGVASGHAYAAQWIERGAHREGKP